MFIKTEEIIVQTETRKTVFKELMDWKGNSFESSSSRTPEFSAFAGMFRSHIKWFWCGTASDCGRYFGELPDA